MSGQSWLGPQILGCRSDHNERVELDRTPNTRLQEHAMNEGRVGQDPKYKAVGAWTE